MGNEKDRSTKGVGHRVMRTAGSMSCIQCTCSPYFDFISFFFLSVQWTSVYLFSSLFFSFSFYFSHFFCRRVEILKWELNNIKLWRTRMKIEDEGRKTCALCRVKIFACFARHQHLHRNIYIVYSLMARAHGIVIFRIHFDTFIILLRCGTMTRKWLMDELLISR